MMNYMEELKAVEEYKAVEYWKPTAGKYKVVILGEPTSGYYTSLEGDKKPQIEMEVSINEVIFKWTVTKGLSARSLYGQLMKLAVMSGNTLTGVCFTLLVTGSGKNKNYTVMEEFANGKLP